MSDRVIAGRRSDEEAQYEAGLRPRSLSDYIGQDRVRAQLHVSIEAARHRREALDHVLLYGPPGLGKTTLCASGSLMRTPSRNTLTPWDTPTTGESRKPRISSVGCARVP